MMSVAALPRVRQGQPLTLYVLSSTAAVLRATAWLRYDDGTMGMLYIPEVTTAGTRTEETFQSPQVAIKDGIVVDSVVQPVTNLLRRGQVLTRLAVGSQLPAATVLSQDYAFHNHWPTLGANVDPGPDGGSGFLNTAILKAVGAPAASTNLALGVSNSVRRYRSIAWYYNASADAASRVLSVTWHNPLLALPTGFGTAANAYVWVSQSLTLTASQEGTLYADEHISVKNQNGTITIDNRTTAPTPFPILVGSNDTGDLIFAVTDSNANDRDAIYEQFEEWLVMS